MQDTYCHITISATDRQEADLIADTLLTKKLISGALILNGPSRYWWQGKIDEQVYYNISCYSLMKNKDEIISEVKKVHKDKVPIIAFSEIDGNKDFLEWIKESVK